MNPIKFVQRLFLYAVVVLSFFMPDVISAANGKVNGGTSVCQLIPQTVPLVLKGYTGSIVKWQSAQAPFNTWADITNTAVSYSVSNLQSTTAYRAVLLNGSQLELSDTALIVVAPVTRAGTVTCSVTKACAGTVVTFNLTGNTGNIVNWQYALGPLYNNWIDLNSTATSIQHNLVSSVQVRAIVQSSPCYADPSTSATVTVTPVGTFLQDWNNWTDPRSWSCSQVPNSTTDVIIPEWRKYAIDPYIDGAADANSVYLGDFSTLSFAPGAVLSVKGALTISGAAKFYPQSGTVHFSGSSAQTIPAATYGGLRVSGGGAKSLAGNVTVTGTLTLDNGVIYLGNYNLTLESTANIVGGNAASFIVTNGSGRLIIKNVGAGTHTGNIRFPVGANANSYTPLTINNTGTADDYSLGMYDYQNSSYNSGTPAGNTYTSNAVGKTWVLAESTAGGSNLAISVQWNQSDELSGFNRANASLNAYNGAGTPIPGAVFSGINPYTLAVNNVTVLYPLGITSTPGSPLPPSVGGSVSGGGSICPGATSGLLTLTGHTGSVIKWQWALAPYTSWTDINTTSTTYTSGALTATTAYRAVVQNGSAPVAYSTYAIVTVSGSGGTTFTGNQVIPGGTYCSITIDGGGIKVLGGNVTITGQLILTQGIVQLENFNLVLESGAVIVGGNSTAFVYTNRGGKLIQRNIGPNGRSGAVLFPVGATATLYSPITILNAGTTDDYSVQVLNHLNSSYNGSIPTGTTYTSKHVNKTWLLEEVTGGGSDLDVEVQWNKADELVDFDRQNASLEMFVGAATTLGNLTVSGTNPYSASFHRINRVAPLGIASGLTAPPSGNGDFEVNNANGVVLNTNTTITGRLILTNGLLYLGNYDLILEPGAQIVGGGNTSYIVTNGGGRIIQKGIGNGGRTGNIVFPVGGTSGYSPLTINNTGVADLFALQVLDFQNSSYNGTIPTGTTYTNRAVAKTWLLTEGISGGSNLSLTFQWNSGDELTQFTRSSLSLIAYNGAGSVIGTGSAAGANPYTYTATGITSVLPMGLYVNNQVSQPGVTSLVVNTSSGMFLQNNTTITGSLTLTNGLLYLGNYDLTIAAGASISGGSASSYIVTNGAGRLIIQNIGPAGLNGSVVYPVGAAASSYTPVTLRNTGTTDHFSIRLLTHQNSSYNGTNPTGTTYTNNAVAKTWIIEEATVGGSNLTVNLLWNASDELNGFIRSQLMVRTYNGAGLIIANGAATGSVGGPYAFTLSGLTQLRPLGIHNYSALPLRVANDGGLSQANHNKSTQAASTYTGLATMEIEGLLVYPNPFQNVISISGLNQTENVEVFMYDLTGKQIAINAVLSNGGIQVLVSEQLNKGLYTLLIKQNNQTKVVRLMQEQ